MRSQHLNHRPDTVRKRGYFLAVVVPSSVLLDDLMVADAIDLITTKRDDLEYFSAAQLAAVPCCRSHGAVTVCGTLVCMFLGLIGLGVFVCLLSECVPLT